MSKADGLLCSTTARWNDTRGNLTARLSSVAFHGATECVRRVGCNRIAVKDYTGISCHFPSRLISKTMQHLDMRVGAAIGAYLN